MTVLRLLTSVLVAPYYPALLLANQVATLDVISGGRLILGVGTGWNPAEFDAVGVPARERGARTDDHLAAAKHYGLAGLRTSTGPSRFCVRRTWVCLRSLLAARRSGSAGTAMPRCGVR